MSKFIDMTDAEDIMYILIMNDESSLTKIRGMMQWSESSIENTLNNTIYEVHKNAMNSEYQNEKLRMMLIFIHIMESSNLIGQIKTEIKEKYIKKGYVKPGIGDIVQHTSNTSLIGEIVGETSSGTDGLEAPNKWVMSYINTSSKRVRGEWLKANVDYYPGNYIDHIASLVPQMLENKTKMNLPRIEPKIGDEVYHTGFNAPVTAIITGEFKVHGIEYWYVKYKDGMKSDWLKVSTRLKLNKPTHEMVTNSDGKEIGFQWALCNLNCAIQRSYGNNVKLDCYPQDLYEADIMFNEVGLDRLQYDFVDKFVKKHQIKTETLTN